MSQSNLPANDDIAIVKQVADWVSHRVKLEDGDAELLENIVNSQKTRIEAYFAVLGAHRVQRMQKLISFAQQVEEQLFIPARLENATTSELIRMYGVVTDGMNDAVEFLNGLLGKNIKIVINGGVNINNTQNNLNVYDRESIRSIIDGLVSTRKSLNDSGRRDPS